VTCTEATAPIPGLDKGLASLESDACAVPALVISEGAIGGKCILDGDMSGTARKRTSDGMERDSMHRATVAAVLLISGIVVAQGPDRSRTRPVPPRVDDYSRHSGRRAVTARVRYPDERSRGRASAQKNGPAGWMSTSHPMAPSVDRSSSGFQKTLTTRNVRPSGRGRRTTGTDGS
jgi:hypothetical protein